MSDILNLAIESVNKSLVAYCKSITPNDVGKTGGHQYGYHLHKNSWSLYFDKKGVRGENLEKFAKIKWQNDFTTESRFIYYGVGTRDEYRVTRFGKDFPYLKDENIGDLLIICKIEDGYYEAYILHTDEDIENFLASVSINITDVNAIIPKTRTIEATLEDYYKEFVSALTVDFPPSIDISNKAREIFSKYYSGKEKDIINNPDRTILGWVDIEYQLFKAIENSRYANFIKGNFKDVDQLVQVSNTILNRRKSRAGKSLEHHLEEIFKTQEIRFETQVKTEGNKKPDFIFPGYKQYHDLEFLFENLVFLGAKTTCKDRWRQVLNEANRIPGKHLFTLQQGVSANQLEEMKEEKVTLVIPHENFKYYPKEGRADIMSLGTFIDFVRTTQARI